MNLLIQTLEFWPYFDKHWNSHLILSNTGILALFLMNIGFLILSFPTLEFWPYIFTNIVVLIFSVLALKTLEFWSYFCKQWSSHLILPKIGILALFVHV